MKSSFTEKNNLVGKDLTNYSEVTIRGNAITVHFKKSEDITVRRNATRCTFVKCDDITIRGNAVTCTFTNCDDITIRGNAVGCTFENCDNLTVRGNMVETNMYETDSINVFGTVKSSTLNGQPFKESSTKKRDFNFPSYGGNNTIVHGTLQTHGGDLNFSFGGKSVNKNPLSKGRFGKTYGNDGWVTHAGTISMPGKWSVKIDSNNEKYRAKADVSSQNRMWQMYDPATDSWRDYMRDSILIPFNGAKFNMSINSLICSTCGKDAKIRCQSCSTVYCGTRCKDKHFRCN